MLLAATLSFPYEGEGENDPQNPVVIEAAVMQEPDQYCIIIELDANTGEEREREKL